MFDTLRYSRILEAVGISRDQAEAHIKIIAEIIEGDLATKQDIRHEIERLEHKMVELESRLIIKLGVLVGAIVTLAIATTAAITKLL